MKVTYQKEIVNYETIEKEIEFPVFRKNHNFSFGTPYTFYKQQSENSPIICIITLGEIELIIKIDNRIKERDLLNDFYLCEGCFKESNAKEFEEQLKLIEALKLGE